MRSGAVRRFGWSAIRSGDAVRAVGFDAAERGRTGCAVGVCYPRPNLINLVEASWLTVRVRVGERTVSFSQGRTRSTPQFFELGPGRVDIRVERAEEPEVVHEISVAPRDVFLVFVEPRWREMLIVRRRWHGPSLRVEQMVRGSLGP